MRSFRTLLILLSLLGFSLGSQSADIQKGRQLSTLDLRAGSRVLLANATTVNASDPCPAPNGSFLQSAMSMYDRAWAGTGLNIAPGISDDNVWMLVSAPDQRGPGGTAMTSYYLQHVKSGMYVTGSCSERGAQVNGLTPNVSEALSFALEGLTSQSTSYTSAVSSQSVAMVHYEEDLSRSYFGPCWSYGFAAYVNEQQITIDTYIWNVFALDVRNQLDQLLADLDQLNLTAGTGYGTYPEQDLAQFRTLMDQARSVVKNGDEDACQQMMDRLDAAYAQLKTKRNRLPDGYYHIVNDNTFFQTRRGCEAAMRAGDDAQLYWADADYRDPRFVFHLAWTGTGDEYWMKSWAYGNYAADDMAVGHHYICMTAEPEVPQVLTYCDDGTFQLGHPGSDVHYYTSSISNGGKSYGHISFSNENANFNHWRLRPVGIDSLAVNLDYLHRMTDATALTQQALALYDRCLGMASTTQGLIQTYADDETSEIVATNLAAGSAVSALGDNDPATGITITSTASSAAECAHVTVKLVQPVEAFAFGFDGTNPVLLPRRMTVYGRQGDDDLWIKLATEDYISLHDNAWLSGPVHGGVAYAQLRFDVNENQGSSWTYGFPSLSLGSFQLYGVAPVDSSLYYTLPGMDRACDSLLVAAQRVRRQMSLGAPTDAQLEALRAAIGGVQYLNDSLQVRTALQQLVDEIDMKNFPIGTEVGQFGSLAVRNLNMALYNARLALQRNAVLATLTTRLANLRTTLAAVWDSQVGGEKRLTGSLIASETSTTPRANAFDDDPATLYRSTRAAQGWVGLALADSAVVTRIGYRPMPGRASAMTVAVFEGARRSDFSDAIPLYIVPEEPSEDGMTYVDVRCTRAFKYLRYVSPNNGFCQLADLSFYGRCIPGSDSLLYQATEVPLVCIRTDKGEHDVNHDIYSVGTLDIISDGGVTLFSDSMQVRGRGNGSWTFPQKPMKFKLFHKAHVLGMPAKAKKWTLVNNYRDKTFIRNPLTFEIGRMFGLPYTPATQCVDVVFNGEYKGSFLLGDQVEVRKHRVPVTEMTPDDNEGENLTGGYLIELDGYAASEPKHFYSTLLKTPISLKYPDEDEITPQQWAYVQRDYNEMEALIMGQDYDNPTIGYRSRLDIQSFLRRFIVEEYAGNYDAYHSVFMWKERGDAKWVSCPLWDFDLAMDNCSWNYPTCGLSNFLSMTRGGVSGARTSLDRIIPDNDDLMTEIWSDARYRRNFTVERMWEYVDSMAAAMDRHQALHFQRWPILNTVIVNTSGARGSYQAEVDFLKEYLRERMDWMDNRIGLVEPEGVHQADLPASGRIVARQGQLLVEQFPARSQCDVVTMDGRLVLRQTLGDAPFVRSLPAGIYAVRVVTPQGAVSKRKVIVE